jgi:hypothetical protein
MGLDGAFTKENVNLPPGVCDGGWRNLDHHKGKEPNREYPSGAADVAEVERGDLRGIEVGDDKPAGAKEEHEAINHDKAEILRRFCVDGKADGK